VELPRQQALELPALNPRCLLAGALATLALAAPATAGTPTAPVYDSKGNVIGAPVVPAEESGPTLGDREAIQLALGNRKVADWVRRYHGEKLTKEASFDAKTGLWTVKVWAPGAAGQIVLAKVEDSSVRVTEAWTGPQVAWKMARGYDGAFGRRINDPWIWLSFCGIFLLGLANWRKPLSLRNLDLLVLLSFSISLWLFNRGEIFRAMPLVYPPLLYLLGRVAWIAWRGRATPSRAVWPVWLLIGATVFLAGFKIGLNLRSSNVIDVGYAGVIGAERIASEGQMPYGHMPTDVGRECGKPDGDGYVRERIQDNGRCESANDRGDTYGPVSYLAYVPGFAIFGWSGKWETSTSTGRDLPAAHFTSILFDLLALVGMGLVGKRFGGARLGATLAFAWAAYPFTQYVSNSNSNDAIMPALLIWGFLFLHAAPARGFFLALGSWTKFASLLLLPLWASYPRAIGRRSIRTTTAFAGGFLLATVLAFAVVFLEPDPLHALHVFWDRTFGWQLDRPSPFSIWHWDDYPGYPDLHVVQSALKVLLLVASVALGFVPRVKTPLRLAALSAALLMGFELVLTHWFYLYIPWFFPFVAFALLAPAVRPRQPHPVDPGATEVRELVPAAPA
jgi:hypothetical protein